MVSWADMNLTFSMMWKILSSLCTLGIIAMSLTFSTQTTTLSQDINRFFITNTFLSTYYSNAPALTWNPGGEAASATAVLGNASACLNVAGLYADKCPQTAVADYTACLNGNTAYLACTTAAILGYQTQGGQYVSTMALYDQLWSCASQAFGAQYSQAQTYQACAVTVIQPPLDVIQDTYSSTLLGSVNWQFMIGTGLWIIASFGVYTFWLANDGPGWFNENGDGKPGGTGNQSRWLARGGIALTLFAMVWNALGLIPMGLAAWRISGSNSAGVSTNAPMSIQTTLWTFMFLTMAVVYFLSELWEMGGYTIDVTTYTRMNAGNAASEMTTLTPAGGARHKGLRSMPSRRKNETELGYYIHKNNDDTREIRDQSLKLTPLFVPAFADAWLLSDTLLAIGLFGLGQDVMTPEMCNVAFLVLYASALHSAFQRFMQVSYTDEYGAAAAEEQEAFAARVMTLASHVGSCIMYSLATKFIWDRLAADDWFNMKSTVQAYVITAWVVPATFWLIVMTVVEQWYGDEETAKPLEKDEQAKTMSKKGMLQHLTWAQFAFMWGLAVRFIVSILVYTYTQGSPVMAQQNDRLVVLLAGFNAN